MDLDNIKKSWQKADIKPIVSEDKIQKMIDNKGKSAFNSLLRYEKFGIILLILCIPLGLIVFEKYAPVSAFYACSVLLGLCWQIYKFVKLKQIDMATMGITEISERFLWYRKAIAKELAIGIVWFIVIVLFIGYLEFSSHIEKDYIPHLIIFISCMTLAFIGVLLTYKMLYWKNIKKMQDSINEVKEFEKDNNE